MQAFPVADRGTSRGIERRIRRMSAGVVVLCALLSAACAGPGHAQATSRDSTATLAWSAPGDDGTSGRATRYEMRYRNVAIAGVDTASWWNAATMVAGMPSPSVAGAADSVSVRGLSPGQTWYFILRTADEVPNWSNFSNVAIRAPYVDGTAPGRITDLVNAATVAQTPPPGAMPESAR